MKHQSGFSLIEVLLSLGLIGVFAVSVPSALSGASKATMTMDERTTAETLARSQMDYIQNQPYDSVNATPQYNAISNIPTSYSIVTPFATRLDPRGDGTSQDDGLQQITVTVRRNGEDVYTLVDFKVNFKP